MKPDVYQIVTNQILEALDSGVVPWRKEWQGVPGFGQPYNLKSKKAYRGINILLLGLEKDRKGYSSEWWLTFKQAKELGGSVRKGEKSTMIVFWLWFKVKGEDKNGEEAVSSRPMLRYYRVFNADQCELPAGTIPEPETIDRPDLPETAAQGIIDGMPNRPEIIHNDADRAFYRPSDDSVTLPNHYLFNSVDSYFSTAFHELAHSTGHDSRLGRHSKGQKQAAFGSEEYGKEELVAEISAAFLCSLSGISNATIENQAAYIAKWKQTISADKRMVVTAAAQAQKAADYVLDKTQEVTA